ncbi:MAG: CDC48 family AAA ATPase, partial [Chloroflexi bacterium]|nr:CDC48 family AAA ATPase [Chloroflexota bacterium]
MADQERGLTEEEVLFAGLAATAGAQPGEAAPQPAAETRRPEIYLRVAEALHGDVGRGLARMDPHAFEALGLSSGALVAVVGRRTTVVRVELDPGGEGRHTIRLDGLLRDNAQVGLDDRVRVRPGSASPAFALHLAPPEPGTYDQDDQARMCQELRGRVLGPGDRVRVASLARGEQVFRVVSTEPMGPVVVDEVTSLRFQVVAAPKAKGFQVRYEDIGGLEDELRRVRELVELPMKYPALFARLRIEPPRGVLLYGPPGTGKTLIARAVASEVEAEFIHVNGPEIMQKFYGESEARLREIFDDAQRKAPSIIFLDEIDALAPKRIDVAGEVEKRVVAQLLALMDGLVARGQVVVIGATNLPEMVDPALRRPGRFDREIPVNVPSRPGRLQILRVHSRGMPLAPDVDLERLAEVTHGFVGADLQVLCKEAGMLALHEVLDQAGFEVSDPTQLAATTQIHLRHFLAALRGIEPTATREVFVEKPNARWSDVGGLGEVREFLRSAVELPRLHAELFQQAGIRSPKGILFSGPTGTGKTLVARALACETGMSFITADAATVFSKWMGESEKTLRQVFLKAKQAAPCLLFFDEIDALAPVRGGMQTGGATDRIIGQFLGELDSLDELSEVVVLAATNRLDLVDPALLSPGRFGYVLEFPLPTLPERREILGIHAGRMPLAEDVDLDELARGTEGFSGSDLAALCQRAAMEAIRAL